MNDLHSAVSEIESRMSENGAGDTTTSTAITDMPDDVLPSAAQDMGAG